MIEIKPMKRICPSLMLVSFLNVSRQTDGRAKGNNPSITSMSANAVNQGSDMPNLFDLTGTLQIFEELRIGIEQQYVVLVL